MQYITKQRFEEIEYCWLDMDEYHKKLKEYTGIQVRRYVAYQYFDNYGNYIGDSSTSGLEDLLDAAHIEVI